MTPEEVQDKIQEDIGQNSIFTRIYKEHMDSKLCEEYEDLQILTQFHMDIDSRPILIELAMTDNESDDGNDFENFGGTGMVVLPRSIIEAMYADPFLMDKFRYAFADRLDELGDHRRQCIASGITPFMRMWINERKNVG